MSELEFLLRDVFAEVYLGLYEDARCKDIEAAWNLYIAKHPIVSSISKERLECWLVEAYWRLRIEEANDELVANGELARGFRIQADGTLVSLLINPKRLDLRRN
jgi:hypothetical protein